MAAGSLFPPWSNIGSTNLKTCAEPNWRVEPERSTVVSVTRCPSTKVSASGPCGVTVTIPSLCMRLQWWGRIPGPSSWRQTMAGRSETINKHHSSYTRGIRFKVKLKLKFLLRNRFTYAWCKQAWSLFWFVKCDKIKRKRNHFMLKIAAFLL